MRKQPYRPDGDITQQYNDGVVAIYTATDSAVPGYKPVESLTLKCTLRYAERRLGLTRYYQDKQNQIETERVLRIPRMGIDTQDVAITEDGRQYTIGLVQLAQGVYPSSLDISLSKIEQNPGGNDDELAG